MSFPRYPAYKESGVQWIAALPAHWNLKRFKSIFAERIDKSEHGDELLLSVSAYTGVTPRSELVDDGDHLSRAESLEGYKRCFKDDLVMNIMLAWNRGLAFTQFEGIVSPAYCVFKVIDGSHPQFLNYLVRSDEYTAYFKAFSSGVIDSRLRIYPETFGALLCALPPTAEQAGIASFLDHETAKIDALVAEQERLIELLKEKRQAVISHAVTKGLNPSVPMKDSGVEWLGEVPAHWALRPLKSLAKFRSGGTPDKSMPEYWDGDIPWASAKDLKVDQLLDTIDHITQFALDDGAAALVPAEAVVVVVRGMILARYFPVTTLKRPMAINQDLKALLPSSEVDAGYLAWLLRASEPETLNCLDEAGHGTKALRMENWGGMTVPVPPVQEQAAISDVLETATGQLDSGFAELKQAISLLQERRTALISAAVTGQIDVRGWVTAETAA